MNGITHKGGIEDNFITPQHSEYPSLAAEVDQVSKAKLTRCSYTSTRSSEIYSILSRCDLAAITFWACNNSYSPTFSTLATFHLFAEKNFVALQNDNEYSI